MHLPRTAFVLLPLHLSDFNCYPKALVIFWLRYAAGAQYYTTRELMKRCSVKPLVSLWLCSRMGSVYLYPLSWASCAIWLLCWLAHGSNDIPLAVCMPMPVLVVCFSANRAFKCNVEGLVLCQLANVVSNAQVLDTTSCGHGAYDQSSEANCDHGS